MFHSNTLKHQLRIYVTRIPWLYLPITRWRAPHLVVSQSTEIVIDGYPRCGNSFAEAAFRLPQKRNVRIAHHCHASAQVLYAVQQQIPCVVLIRNPVHAIASFTEKRAGSVSLDMAMKEYFNFYRAINPYIEKIVLADFETVIGDFSRVIDGVNKKYDTDFENWPERVVDNNIVMSEVERLNQIRNGTHSTGYGSNANPTDLVNRRRRKDAIHNSIMSEGDHGLLRDCEALYESLVLKSV